MKFKTQEGTIQISGITRVVVNAVKVIEGKKVKVNPTYLWQLTAVKKGERWLKYEMESFNKARTVLELNQGILDGVSREEMHMQLAYAMEQEDFTVWFSGNTCNVEHNLTLCDEIVERKVGKMKMRIAIEKVKEHIDRIIEELDERGC